MKEEELKGWLEEITLYINSLSKEAFVLKDINAFRKNKNKILIHFIGVTASIEELFIESEETKCSE